jgi:hypothetical protein
MACESSDDADKAERGQRCDKDEIAAGPKIAGCIDGMD